MRPTAQRAKPAIDTVTLVSSPGNAGIVSPPAESGEAELPRPTRARPLGVYIHFPWCLVKCPYCDFIAFRRAPDRIEHARYADAIRAELHARAARMGAATGFSLRSVFFGGGTPSLWRAEELGRVLRDILDLFAPAPTNGRNDDPACAEPAPTGRRTDDPVRAEVSVECDPAHFDETTAQALRDQGVERVSIGVQSFHDERLAFLGRAHRVAQARAAVEAAVKRGVPHVAVDLLYGLPGLAAETAAAEARQALELGATHVSSYCLTIETNTVFGRLTRLGRLPLLDDGMAADSFLAIHEKLTSAGLEHYEISNYARLGHRSVHNLGYWQGHDYLGLGCGAVGTLRTGDAAAVRYRNEPHPGRYLEKAEPLERMTDPRSRPAQLDALAADRETLDPSTRLHERIMLGLRMVDGFDLTQAGRDCGVDPWTPERLRTIDALVSCSRIAREGDRLRIPAEAWIWADATAAALF